MRLSLGAKEACAYNQPMDTSGSARRSQVRGITTACYKATEGYVKRKTPSAAEPMVVVVNISQRGSRDG